MNFRVNIFRKFEGYPNFVLGYNTPGVYQAVIKTSGSALPGGF